MDENQELLIQLRKQEDDLQFTRFSNETALEVGLALLRAANTRNKPVTIDIARNGQQLFHYAMPGTSRDNDEWVRRKNNVVNRFGRSSYAVGVSLRHQGQTIEEKYLISSLDYAAHGGAFPLIIRGVGVVGTIAVSGLPQQEDHELIVTTLAQFLSAATS